VPSPLLDVLYSTLLSKDPTSLEVLDGAHHTPLYVAVMKQSTRIVEVLLRAGASPLLPQAPPFSYHLQKTTCIHALAQYGSKEIFDLITRISKAKIGPFAPYYRECCVELMFCFFGFFADLAHLIGHNKNGYTPLHLAATAGNSEMIECVLRFISDPAKAITMEDYMGAKPLHSACARGHLECVELLLAHGANVDDVNTAKGRWTPLHYAAAAGYALLRL
jgi:ankyrin repeat protein